ncbi:MAG: YqgE/AlgH family protein [bacterium]
MPIETINLTGHFLIAMPAMADPNFSKTVTYICEHNEKGALGVVVNRPTDMTLEGLFEQVDIPLESPRLRGLPVHYGGPVQVDRGFVLHKPIGNWQSTLQVRNDIGLTTSKDILTALGQGGGPEQVLITIGYAGWAAGQLENEIRQNAWLTVDADAVTLFDLAPEARLTGALGLLGIDLSRLSEQAGHA